MTLCSGAVCNATLTKKKTMEKFNKHPYFPLRTLRRLHSGRIDRLTANTRLCHYL